jgi:hypothetical protein
MRELNLDPYPLGSVDYLSVGRALLLRTGLRTIGANQFLANRLANLVREVASPSSRLCFLADGGIAQAVLASDFPNAELPGTVLALYGLPIRLRLVGHGFLFKRLLTLSLSARAFSAICPPISLARVAPSRMSPRTKAFTLDFAAARACVQERQVISG